MNYLSIILRIISILAAIAACWLYYISKDKLEEQKKETQRVQAQLQSSLEDNEVITLELSSLKKEAEENTIISKESISKLEEVRAELSAEKKERNSIQAQLNKIKRENNDLNEKAALLSKELINTERKLADKSQESEIAQLSERVEELMAANAQLSQKLKGSEISPDISSIQASTDISKLSPDELSQITEETKIASLSLSNGIVVLETDETLDFQIGSILQLVKDSGVIAKVKIVNVNETLAIADVLPGARPEELIKGDTVKILR